MLHTGRCGRRTGGHGPCAQGSRHLAGETSSPKSYANVALEKGIKNVKNKQNLGGAVVDGGY